MSLTAAFTGAPIVEARGARKTYDTGAVCVDALRGIDLTVERGEMVAIMGPSGCGKTTLLNCLSGLDSIDDGDVLIEGTSLKAMSDRERTDYRARRMGFVFQFYNLIPVLTAVENAELPLLVARVPSGEAEKALRTTTPGIDATDFTAVGSQSVLAVDAQQLGAGRAPENYLVRGLDSPFLEHTTFGLGDVARGYGSAEEVWAAVRTQPGLAVVDSLIVPRRDNWNFGPPPNFSLSGLYFEEGFDPIPIEVVDKQTGNRLRLTVIGILKDTRLIQGFMGLGLLVGVAALGVISARAVVERRQQIGVMRAIGFRRGMVQSAFLLESSFVALTSIVVGTTLGLLLAWNIVRDTRDQPSWENLTLVVPWLNLALIFLVVYAVALAATLAPAVRASRIRPAEALRYQ